LVQLPVPWVEVYASSLASSSGVHGPFFTFALSQHGGLPIAVVPSAHTLPVLLISNDDDASRGLAI
jgi:hypothetical protein